MLLRLTLSLLLTISFSTLATAQIEWLSWEEAITRHKKEPRKILVDVYTDWCGWCKRMDKTTFVDPIVAKYVSKNFYAVKLNAEQKGDIVYSGHTFKFMPNAGRRGAHELAASLLEKRMSYPSIVYLDESQKRISISPGFKAAKDFITELQFIREGHYRTKTYQEFVKSRGK